MTVWVWQTEHRVRLFSTKEKAFAAIEEDGSEASESCWSENLWNVTGYGAFASPYDNGTVSEEKVDEDRES